MNKLDLLGDQISFYYNGQPTIKTTFGGVISIILSFLLILIIMAFGEDFYKRTNPSVVKSTITPLEYPMHTINNKNFKLAMKFENIDSNMIRNDQLYYILVILKKYKKEESGIWNLTLLQPLEMTSCSEVGMFDAANSNINVNLDSLLCPKMDNITVGGSWEASEFNYLNIYINKCPEGSYNYKGEPCKSEQESELFRSNILYFAYYYQSVIIDSNSYNTGIRQTVKYDYFGLDKLIFKNKYLYFINTVLNTDYGWLIKDRVSEQFLGLSYSYFDFVSFAELETVETQNIISSLSIYFSRDEDIYYREYMKAQTLAAQVGGILKVFIIFGHLITRKYNVYHLQLMNSLNLFAGYKDRSTVLNISNQKTLNKLNEKNPLGLKNNNKNGEIDQSNYTLNLVAKNNILNAKESNVETDKPINMVSKVNKKVSFISLFQSNNNLNNLNLIGSKLNESKVVDNNLSSDLKLNDNKFQQSNFQEESDIVISRVKRKNYSSKNLGSTALGIVPSQTKNLNDFKEDEVKEDKEMRVS